MEHQPHNPDDREESQEPPALEVPIDGAPLEQVSAYLRIAFTEADARGEAIGSDDAQAVATLLAPLLDVDSEMARFARTGDANPVVLHDECQLLTAADMKTPDLDIWVRRLEQHLASRTDIGRRER
jgi:hypothetical protein